MARSLACSAIKKVAAECSFALLRCGQSSACANFCGVWPGTSRSERSKAIIENQRQFLLDDTHCGAPPVSASGLDRASLAPSRPAACASEDCGDSTGAGFPFLRARVPAAMEIAAAPQSFSGTPSEASPRNARATAAAPKAGHERRLISIKEQFLGFTRRRLARDDAPPQQGVKVEGDSQAFDNPAAGDSTSNAASGSCESSSTFKDIMRAGGLPLSPAVDPSTAPPGSNSAAVLARQDSGVDLSFTPPNTAEANEALGGTKASTALRAFFSLFKGQKLDDSPSDSSFEEKMDDTKTFAPSLLTRKASREFTSVPWAEDSPDSTFPDAFAGIREPPPHAPGVPTLLLHPEGSRPRLMFPNRSQIFDAPDDFPLDLPRSQEMDDYDSDDEERDPSGLTPSQQHAVFLQSRGKLVSPKRSLAEQVVISNMMLRYVVANPWASLVVSGGNFLPDPDAEARERRRARKAELIAKMDAALWEDEASQTDAGVEMSNDEAGEDGDLPGEVHPQLPKTLASHSKRHAVYLEPDVSVDWETLDLSALSTREKNDAVESDIARLAL